MSIHKVRSRRRSGKRLSSRHVVHPAPGRKPSESCAKSVKAQKDRKEEHTVYIRKKEKKEKRREASPSRDARSNCGRGARMRKSRLQRLTNRVRQSASIRKVGHTDAATHRPRLAVLLLGDPHLLEGQRGQDGFDPDTVLALKAGNDFDLQGRERLGESVACCRQPRRAANFKIRTGRRAHSHCRSNVVAAQELIVLLKLKEIGSLGHFLQGNLHQEVKQHEESRSA